MPILSPDMIFFILLLLESEDIITEEQRKNMMKTARKISQGIPMSEASSRLLEIIKEEKNKR